MKHKLYIKTNNAAHGWLHVSEEDVAWLRVEPSDYSRLIDGWWYLEEDDDAVEFLKAAAKAGWDVQILVREVGDVAFPECVQFGLVTPFMPGQKMFYHKLMAV